MTRMKKSKINRSLIVIVILIILGYYLVPALVHFYYRSQTSPQEIAKNIKLYNDVSVSIMKGTADINDAKKVRDSIYIWFHVRGLQIDEGHEGLSKKEQWSEIIDCWN
jgi:uncharacterized membrane protein